MRNGDMAAARKLVIFMGYHFPAAAHGPGGIENSHWDYSSRSKINPKSNI